MRTYSYVIIQGTSDPSFPSAGIQQIRNNLANVTSKGIGHVISINIYLFTVAFVISNQIFDLLYVCAERFRYTFSPAVFWLALVRLGCLPDFPATNGVAGAVCYPVDAKINLSKVIIADCPTYVQCHMKLLGSN